jgi:hypothetical protein
MLYVCRFTLVEGTGVMYGSVCFLHAALRYLCFFLAKALTLMLCSLGFAVSNVEDFDNMSRYLQLVGISTYYYGLNRSLIVPE